MANDSVNTADGGIGDVIAVDGDLTIGDSDAGTFNGLTLEGREPRRRG